MVLVLVLVLQSPYRRRRSSSIRRCSMDERVNEPIIYFSRCHCNSPAGSSYSSGCDR